MFMRLFSGWRSPAALLFAVLSAEGIAVPLLAQSNESVAQDTNAKALAFEVVSIKPNNSESQAALTQPLPNGFRYVNMPLSSLVDNAYLDIPGSKVTGMPGWANSDRYDIEAKVDAGTAEAWKKFSGAEVRKQQQAMIRTLLADRCKLIVHWETREQPVYDLVIAKGGLRMKAATPDEGSGLSEVGGLTTRHLTAHAATVDEVASLLSDEAGRKIVDKTDLGAKKFDFELTWTPADRPTTNDATDAGPSLFSVLEEQLGLKLVPSKGPVDFLIIDHMERPSPN